jgi:hypothetical protein
LLDTITVKYLRLLTGDGHSCKPVRQDNWRGVLLMPWIEDDDLRAAVESTP